MTKKSNPSIVYSIVKVIAVLLVVFAHSTRMYTPSGAFSPLNQSIALAKITDYIYIFHMPLFMFVSGSVYGLCIQQGKYEKKLAFIGNKAKRLLIPYFVFGFLYVAPVMRLVGLSTKGYASYCINGIAWSLNPRHLWFLLALFIIFIFAIFLREWFLKSHYTRVGVLLLAIAGSAVAKHMPLKLQLNAAFSYQLFFMAGVVFHFYYDKAEEIFAKIKYAGLILPIILVGSFFYNPNESVYSGYQFVGIFMVFLFAVWLEKKTEIHKNKIFQYIQDRSMGLFLFHPMIIYLGYYYLGSRDIPPLVLSMGMAVVSFGVSVVLTKIIRLLRLKIILGE